MPQASTEGHRARNQILTFLIEVAELSAHYSFRFKDRGLQSRPDLFDMDNIAVPASFDFFACIISRDTSINAQDASV